MLENRHIHFIIILLMIGAIVFTSIFMISPESLGLVPSSTTESGYTSRLFNKEEVVEINIEMNQEDWDWIIKNAEDEEYRNANIIINGEKFMNVGIRPKGNSSLSMVAKDDTSDRFSFKIKFDQYVKGQTYYGLDKLVLNNMMSDSTYMKEYLSYDLFEKMGIVTPLYSFSNININDEPWGLYLAVEATEERFLNRSFGNDYGNLYKPEDTGASLKWVDEKHYSYQGIKDNAQTKITDEDFDKVVDMIKNLNDGTELDKYLNIDEILRYFAVNTLLVNQDSYTGNFNHNYLLYENDGSFSILPWDLNMSFAGFQFKDGQQAVNFAIDTPYNGSAENFPLLSKLLEVPEYKELYHKYLEDAISLYFDNGLFDKTIDKLDNLINLYVKNDATAFYTYDEYTASLPVLKEFGRLRAKSVLAQLTGKTLTDTVDLNLNALGSMGAGSKGMDKPNGARDKAVNGEKEFGNSPETNIGPNFYDQDANLNRPQEARIDGTDNSNKGNMISPENMEKVMAIMQESNEEDLSESQISRLKELGLDEKSIEQFKNGHVGFPAENMGRGKQRTEFNNSRNLMPTLIITGVCTLLMLIAILFVSKFKRYRYAIRSKDMD